MARRIAVSVFLATILYQFIDAGAELLVPFYDRGGVVAALLFWSIPAATAFVLGFKEADQHARDSQRRKRVYAATVIGAAVGQFVSVVVLLPTPALPDMTLGGGVILAGITAMFAMIAVAAGIMLVLAAMGDEEELINYRHSQILGVICLSAPLLYLSTEVSNLSSPYLTENDAVVFLLAGIWLLILARTVKQNSGNKSGEKEPATA